MAILANATWKGGASQRLHALAEIPDQAAHEVKEAGHAKGQELVVLNQVAVCPVGEDTIEVRVACYVDERDARHVALANDVAIAPGDGLLGQHERLVLLDLAHGGDEAVDELPDAVEPVLTGDVRKAFGRLVELDTLDDVVRAPAHNVLVIEGDVALVEWAPLGEQRKRQQGVLQDGVAG